MEKQLNAQIKEEFFSSLLYLSASAWCSARDLDGMAHFFRLQSQEEFGHGMKIYDYLFEVGSQGIVPGIAQPSADFKTVEQVFKQALDHEKHVSGLIHKLMQLAHQEDDYGTINFLNWFVTEQIEEESQIKLILAKLNMVGSDKRGLYMLDKELAKRE